MPEMQPSMPSDAVMPVSMVSASAFDDIDYALGCECADPALQIDSWGQDAAGLAEAN